MAASPGSTASLASSSSYISSAQKAALQAAAKKTAQTANGSKSASGGSAPAAASKSASGGSAASTATAPAAKAPSSPTISSANTYKVGADGKAPTGLSAGSYVVTGGGTYKIDSVNADGTYKASLYDKNTNTNNYTGSYATVQSKPAAQPQVQQQVQQQAQPKNTLVNGNTMLYRNGQQLSATINNGQVYLNNDTLKSGDIIKGSNGYFIADANGNLSEYARGSAPVQFQRMYYGSDGTPYYVDSTATVINGRTYTDDGSAFREGDATTNTSGDYIYSEANGWMRAADYESMLNKAQNEWYMQEYTEESPGADVTQQVYNMLDDYYYKQQSDINRTYANMQNLYNQIVDAGTDTAIEQLRNQLNKSTQEYNQQKAQAAYTAAQEADNLALYLSSLGDQGGIGAKQYSDAMAYYDQQIMQISLQQENLQNDIEEKAVELRRNGESEKAEMVIKLGETQLDALTSALNNMMNFREDLSYKIDTLNQNAKNTSFSQALQKLQLGILTPDDAIALGVPEDEAEEWAHTQNLYAAVDLEGAKKSLYSTPKGQQVAKEEAAENGKDKPAADDGKGDGNGNGEIYAPPYSPTSINKINPAETMNIDANSARRIVINMAAQGQLSGKASTYFNDYLLPVLSGDTSYKSDYYNAVYSGVANGKLTANEALILNNLIDLA